MNRILATLVVVFVSLTMNAQCYLGGELGFSNVKNTLDKSTITSFSLKPEVGFKVNDKWSFGTAIGFEFARQKYNSYEGRDFEGQYCVDANSFELSPYARYNALKTGIFTFFFDATASIITMKTETNWEGEDSQSYSGWAVGIAPGVSVAITEGLSLVAHVGAIGYFDTADINNLKGFAMNINSSNLTFGLLWHF